MPASASSFSASSAMAGALERPGLLMPPSVMKPDAVAAMTKSLRSELARTPAKLRMLSRKLTPGTLFAAFSRTKASAAAQVAVSPRSAGSAFGPTIRLPCTVGETSTPLPSLFGHWKIT